MVLECNGHININVDRRWTIYKHYNVFICKLDVDIYSFIVSILFSLKRLLFGKCKTFLQLILFCKLLLLTLRHRVSLYQIKFSSLLIYLNLQIVTHNVIYSQNASPQGLVHRIWNQKVNIIRFENASGSSVIAICGWFCG